MKKIMQEEHLLKLSSVIDELLSNSINKASFVGKALYCERYLSISRYMFFSFTSEKYSDFKYGKVLLA